MQSPKSVFFSVDKERRHVKQLYPFMLMFEQGVHPKIVPQHLGHSFISTTLNIYSNVVPGLQQAAARHFEDRLPGTSLQDLEHAVAQRVQRVIGNLAFGGGFEVEFGS